MAVLIDEDGRIFKLFKLLRRQLFITAGHLLHRGAAFRPVLYSYILDQRSKTEKRLLGICYLHLWYLSVLRNLHSPFLIICIRNAAELLLDLPTYFPLYAAEQLRCLFFGPHGLRGPQS